MEFIDIIDNSFVLLYNQANAIRGVLAAVGCAVLFALVTVVYKFRWRGNGDKVKFHTLCSVRLVAIFYFLVYLLSSIFQLCCTLASVSAK